MAPLSTDPGFKYSVYSGSVGTTALPIAIGGSAGRIVLQGSGYFRVALGHGSAPSAATAVTSESTKTNEFSFSGLTGLEINVPTGDPPVTHLSLVAKSAGSTITITAS